MGLQISTRKTGNVIILDLVGRLIIGTSNDTLSAELRKFAEAGPSEVIVNLVAVSQMDSSGISTLVRSFVTLERQGGGLKVAESNRARAGSFGAYAVDTIHSNVHG